MKLNKVIVLLGPPGSGKGTQADLLANKFGYLHFGIGNLLREYIHNHPEDSEVKDRYDRGILQPDNFVFELFETNFEKSAEDQTGIVFDAFPMSLSQSEFLENLLQSHRITPKVFYIDVSEEEILHRLAQRKICVNCKNPNLPGEESYDADQCRLCGGNIIVRTDDKPEIIKNRIAEYEERMGPIKDYFHKLKQLEVVNGQQAVEQLSNEIISKL